jgi:hypothetical protein
LPTLVAASPSGDAWMHEVKHDGYRAIAVIDAGRPRIFTRRGHDYTGRMPGIVEALSGLPCRSAVIYGGAVILGEDGVSDFFALLAARSPARALVAFDKDIPSMRLPFYLPGSFVQFGAVRRSTRPATSPALLHPCEPCLFMKTVPRTCLPVFESGTDGPEVKHARMA